MDILKNIIELPRIEDEIDMQIARVLRGTLGFFGVASVAYVLASSLADFSNWGRYATQGGILLACMLLGLFYLHKGYARSVAIFETLVIWLVFTLAAYTGGGVRSSGYFGYLVVLVVAGVLSGKRFDTLFVALLCAGVGYYLVYAEMSGLLPPPRVPMTPFALWLDSLLYFSIVAGLLFLTMRITKNAFQRLSLELTERRRAELALRESEARYRGLLENIPSITFLVGFKQGSPNPTMYVSPQIESILGYKAENFTKDPYFLDTIIHPDDLARVTAQAAEADLTGASFSSDYRVIARDGRLFWFRDESVLVRDEHGQPLYRLGVWSDITERKFAEQKAAQAAKQLTMLNEIGRAVSEITDLDAVLEFIRQQLEKLVEFDFYSVRIFNPESMTVTHLAVYESNRYWKQADTPLMPGTDAYQVFETGESVLHLYTPEEIEVYAANPVMQIGDRSHITASVIFTPLKKHGQTIGALSVQQREANSYTEEHLRLVEAVAIQVAIAIENARLFGNLQNELFEREKAEQTSRRKSDQLTTLIEIGSAVSSQRDLASLLETVYQESIRILPFDFFFIGLHEPQTGQITFPIMYDEGRIVYQSPQTLLETTFSGKTILSGKPLLLNQWSENPSLPSVIVGDSTKLTSSLMFAPLQATERVLGVISAQSYEKDAFDEEDLSLLTEIARQVAIAIENARLFADLQTELVERRQAEELTRRVNFELQRRLKELYVLNEVAQAGASTQDEHELIAAAVEIFHRSLSPDIVGVALWNEEQQALRTFPRFHRGMPERVNEMSFRVNEGIVGYVAATQHPYYMKDSSQGDSFYHSIDPDIRSELCVPILAGERLLGVFNIESKQPNAFSDSDERLLVTVAGQLAASLERMRAEQQLRALNADLEQRIAERTAELSAAFTAQVEAEKRANLLRQRLLDFNQELLPSMEPVDVLDLIHKTANDLVPHDVFAPFWVDEARQVLLPVDPRGRQWHNEPSLNWTVSFGQGIIGDVVRKQQAECVNNSHLDPRAVYPPHMKRIRAEHSIFLPVHTGEEMIACLILLRHDWPFFTQSEFEVAQLLLGQARLALRNARIFAQLEASNRELESFSYSVSHDLRAPLRAINGFSKILAEDFSQELSPMARGFLEKISASGAKMAQLIDELLNFSRIGRKPLNRQDVDLTALVKAVIETLAAETTGRQIEWRLMELPPANGDSALLQVVYTNLLGNAVKYSRHRSEAVIEIGSLMQDEELVYFVRDNGAGFDMQFADKLFGVFQRLHRDDEFEGTGIGLATVKRIVEKHGGRIWAEAAVDQGATFYFSLGKA